MTTDTVAGDHGLLVRFLRQSFALRHADDAAFREEMRRDVRHCIACLRHNRNLEVS